MALRTARNFSTPHKNIAQESVEERQKTKITTALIPRA